MNVDELLDLLDETLEESTNLPFTGGKRMVDVDKVRDIIDDIRLNLPSEIKQAKAIVNDRAEIVAGARRESEGIIKKAEDRARILVDQQEIVRQAQQKAAELLSAAQQQSRCARPRSRWLTVPPRSKMCAAHCGRKQKKAEAFLQIEGPVTLPKTGKGVAG